MIVRIVKMTFRPETIAEFRENFNKHKTSIRNFPGCRLLALYQDRSDAAVFFSYSYWDAEADLDAYRASDFFRTVWTETKTFFSAPAEAWSLDKREILP